MLAALTVWASGAQASPAQEPPGDGAWLSFDRETGPGQPTVLLLHADSSTIDLLADLPGCMTETGQGRVNGADAVIRRQRHCRGWPADGNGGRLQAGREMFVVPRPLVAWIRLPYFEPTLHCGAPPHSPEGIP